MTEKPILFSAPMIRAILDGTKSVTRRIAKLPPNSGKVHVDPGGSIFGPGPYLKVEATNGANAGASIHPRIRCPYGYPSDRLWVREAFSHVIGNGVRIVYRADGEPTDSEGHVLPTEPGLRRWSPSIHMPRKDSRITLEVVDVRVERLHSITDDDAKLEGVEPYEFLRRLYPSKLAAEAATLSYREGFHAAWDWLNGKRAPWSSNPWVWRVEFRRVTQ